MPPLLPIVMSSILTSNICAVELSAKIALAVPNTEMAAGSHDNSNHAVLEYMASVAQRLRPIFNLQQQVEIIGASGQPVVISMNYKALIYDAEKQTVVQSTVLYEGPETKFTLLNLAPVEYQLEIWVSQQGREKICAAKMPVTPSENGLIGVHINLSDLATISGSISNQDVYSVIDPILIFGGTIQTIKNGDQFSISACSTSASGFKVWFSRRVQATGSAVIYEFTPHLDKPNDPSNIIRFPDLGLGSTLKGKILLSGSAQDLQMQNFANLDAVTIRAMDSGLSAITHADDEGNFQVECLPPGKYEITMEKPILNLRNDKVAILLRPSQQTSTELRVEAEK